MPELKPCPCCGTEVEDQETYVMCMSCGLMLDRADADGGDYASAWNRRAIPADQVLAPRELLERIAKPRTSIGDVNDGIAAMAELRALLHP